MVLMPILAMAAAAACYGSDPTGLTADNTSLEFFTEIAPLDSPLLEEVPGRGKEGAEPTGMGLV